MMTAAIAYVFSSVGQIMSVKDAYLSLISYYSALHVPCAKQRAAGALGGASRSGFIELVNGNCWKRVR